MMLLRLARLSEFCKIQFLSMKNTSDMIRAPLSTMKKNGPLSGVRVLDLTRILAGPYCSMILGDYGAEVIKVEKPGNGDDTRSWGPPFWNGESTYFLCVNRNKKSIVVDLKNRKAIEQIIEPLVRESDVVIENFLPGTMESLGIGYTHLKEINPKIILASITGFGQTGPYKDLPGYDLMVSAMGGLMSITGEESGPPVRVGVAITDVSTGLFAFGSIASALFYRERTGLGQHIDISLLDTQVACLVNVGSNWLNGEKNGRRMGTAHESIVPYQCFQVEDGHIVVGAGNDNQFARLCEILSLNDLPQDAQFKTNQNRVTNRESLIRILQTEFLKYKKSDVLSACSSHRIPCCPINSMKEVFQDPHVLERGMVRQIEHPTAGIVQMAGIPVKFGVSEGEIYHPPPLLGQHTDKVLENILGINQDQLLLFRSEKLIE